ncbi:hypothetical protein Bca101_077095 [Brassica carinata]
MFFFLRNLFVDTRWLLCSPPNQSMKSTMKEVCLITLNNLSFSLCLSLSFRPNISEEDVILLSEGKLEKKARKFAKKNL